MNPLERFEEDLRALMPRAVSAETRQQTAARLSAPSRRLLTFAGISAAAMVAAVVFIPRGETLNPAPEFETRPVTIAVGCECKVRFTRRSAVPPAARGTGPAASRRLDRGRTAALKSWGSSVVNRHKVQVFASKDA